MICQLATRDGRCPRTGLGLPPYTIITHSVKRRQSVELGTRGPLSLKAPVHGTAYPIGSYAIVGILVDSEWFAYRYCKKSQPPNRDNLSYITRDVLKQGPTGPWLRVSLRSRISLNKIMIRIILTVKFYIL
ncbi:hypothetical protein TNCV_4198301 [Trichonephila clavipes]|nr:hypothetical protein TNCV_4198301 [Trichonephila clavipes]